MSTLEELKAKWEQNEKEPNSTAYSRPAFEKLINDRIKKETRKSFQYFWAAFTFQVIVYALLGHVIAKYWHQTEVVYFALAGIILYIPFTVVLLRKFKRLAAGKLSVIKDGAASLREDISRQRSVLGSFYHFKKWYEFFLVPLSSALGVFLVFELYVPGGLTQNFRGAAITFILTLLSCAYAIYLENKKSFIEPLHQLQNVLNEFDSFPEQAA